MLGVIFFLLISFTINTLVTNPFRAAGNVPETQKEAKAHHYTFFLPSSDYSFFNNLKQGALDASEAMDCAVLFTSINDDPVSFDMASYTGIDGAAVFMYDKNDDMIGRLQAITDHGIPIVQIENQVIMGPNAFLIGTNSFDSGKSIGRIALNADKDKLKIGLIYSEKNPGLMSDANLLEIGLKSTIGDRLDALYIDETKLNPIGAERIVYDLIQIHPKLDIIVLTDISDTLVTIQAIIDLNLVGRIQIIGFGDDQTIREYIRKGVVLGSIVRNPYRIGYSAVMALKEISTIGYTSAYIDTGINIITQTEIMRSRSGRLR